MRLISRILILLAALLLSGCASMMGYNQREMFNVSHREWVNTTRPTTQNIDKIITIRIRAFGDQGVKQAAFHYIYPTLGKIDQGAVSSAIPEIWMDIRENAAGEIVPAQHIEGHELDHILKLYGINVHNPDK
jgi:hypothetical protein